MRAALDLVRHWGGILAAGYLAHQVGSWPAYLLAGVVIAGFQTGLVSLAHEAWHNKTFQPAAINHAVGAWLYSYPVGLAYFHDMHRHLEHHRLIGKPEDPDWENYVHPHFETRASTLRFLFGKLVGMHLATTLNQYLVKGKPRIHVDSESRKRAVPIKRELASIFAVQAALFSVFAVAGHWWEYLLLWVLPLSTLTSFFIATRALLEHANADAPEDPEERLYDFAPNAFGHFFFSPCHFHLHALHHKFPSAPHYRLLTLKSGLHDPETLGYPGSQRGGYVRALGEYLRQLPQKVSSKPS